jgi:hypoxanthine-guanine phosphoribosyltransferase
MAEEGKTISGEDLYQIIKEAKAKGVKVASLIHKLPNSRTQVVITPGPGVVEQAPRARRKKETT